MSLQQTIRAGRFDSALTALYGEPLAARTRYAAAAEAFARQFGSDTGARLFSAPGRTELSGNHTDHNHGRVLAASVDMDILAVASPAATDRIRVCSEGFAPLEITLSDLSQKPDEIGSSEALIRGVAAELKRRGGTIGGFDALITSRVPKGSGLSSSAAYEILIGTILNVLYNDGRFTPVELAMAGQVAENVYFGKPSGLMDQLACAIGGAVAIDFADPAAPVIRRIDVDFAEFGRTLCVTDTGGNHANLTDEYAAITREMKQVANALGVSYLRETTAEALLQKMTALRDTCGDRALLRAFHFFAEDARAEQMAQALERRDIDTYESLLRESGRSSFEFLQNLYAAPNPETQGLSLAVCVSDTVLGSAGATRVHGGGFAGTTQHLVQTPMFPTLCIAMESLFGKGCCHPLRIRPVGGVCLDNM